MRFLLAQFQQESNSFSPVSGTMSMFENNCLMTGEEILPYFAGTRTEMGGFIKALREINAEIIPSVAASSVSCGPVNDQVCEYVLSRIAEDIDRAGSVDCLLLCLHGAMLLESQWDGTGWFLERLRQGLKPGTLIACTLDFHANLTEKTLRNSDILVGYKTYPHIDLPIYNLMLTKSVGADYLRISGQIQVINKLFIILAESPAGCFFLAYILGNPHYYDISLKIP
jgi:microcystin degradation protein MlrC